MLDILVIAPHPDDAELGAAGAILKLKDEGAKVGVLDLTSGEPTPFGSLEKRAAETAAATKILGLDWRENLGLPNRSLEPTLEARRELAIVIRRTRPKWLFAPYWIVRGDVEPTTQMSTQCRWLTASTQPPAGIRSPPYSRARVNSFVSGSSQSRENAHAGSP